MIGQTEIVATVLTEAGAGHSCTLKIIHGNLEQLIDSFDVLRWAGHNYMFACEVVEHVLCDLKRPPTVFGIRDYLFHFLY